ncbi:hypothetical protein [Priestia megaterium]|nr:hypothetical protein [Priestia megaterium]
MWNSIVSYLPEWPVFLQAFMVFVIPYTIYKLFSGIRNSEEE